MSDRKIDENSWCFACVLFVLIIRGHYVHTMFLKYFVSFCVLCGVVRSISIQEVLDAENKCLEQFTSISADVLQEIKKTTNIEQYQKSHPDLNCFFKCVATNLNLIDSDGVLNAPALKQVTTELLVGSLGEEEIHAAVDKCKLESVHDDHCEKIGIYITCKVKALSESTKLELHEDFCPGCKE